MLANVELAHRAPVGLGDEDAALIVDGNADGRANGSDRAEFAGEELSLVVPPLTAGDACDSSCPHRIPGQKSEYNVRQVIANVFISVGPTGTVPDR
jgi:hypothetical protein